MFQHRQSGGNGAASGSDGAALSDSDAASNDVTMYSIAGGYKKGNFKAELNYAYFTASNDVFLNAGNNHLTNNANFIYLAAEYKL